MKLSHFPKYYWFYLIIVLSTWFWYMGNNNLYHILEEHIYVMITMVFGSFIAGSSPEGSASIAYPIFTLYLDVAPETARNFAFAIQSVGMTAASIYIWNKKLPFDRNYVKYVTLGGVFGLILGTFFLAPYIQAKIAKLSFVSIWLSFGMILYYLHLVGSKNTMSKIASLQVADTLILLMLGLIGGFISSIFGTGINIFSFCFVVIYYGMDEKIAAKSSIIIMTIETILGFALHALILKDMNEISYQMWLSCIPIVIFFAPLGTYVLSKISNKTFANFLYFIFLVQYVGAIYVIKPNLYLMAISVAIIILSIFVFYQIYKYRKVRFH